MYLRAIVFYLMISVLLMYSNSFAKNDFALFTFSPKDQTIMIEKVKAYRKNVIGGNKPNESESNVTTRIVYKKTETGWNILASPLEITMKRDGKAINNPLFDILRSNSIKYQVTKNGQMTGVLGYKSIKSDIYKQFEKDTGNKVAKLFDEDVMKKKAFAEWHQKTGRYLGKRVINNEKWEDKETYKLPNGKNLEYMVEREFILNEKFKGKDYVKIIIRYFAGDDEIVNKDNTFITGSAELIIDPGTMLIYSQKMERHIKIDVNLGNKEPVAVELHEKRDYLYEYIM